MRAGVLQSTATRAAPPAPEGRARVSLLRDAWLMNKHNQSPGWRSGALVPRHVAIIMDGNGRWAESRGLPRSAGHHMGVEAVRRTVRAAMELGIQYLTIFSFSSENWARPAAEIDDLMGLMRRFIRWDLAELHQKGVRIGVIGERDRRGPGAARAHRRCRRADVREYCAQPGDRLQLRLAGRDRQGGAAAGRARARRGDQAEDITPEALSAALDTHGVPDPDLLIRTSGELRLSNFLLWQSAYTEFVFLDAYWPDFGRDLLQQAIDEFRGRIRRFGGVVTRSTGLTDEQSSSEGQSDERARRGGRRRRRTPRSARAPGRRFRPAARLRPGHGRGRGAVHVSGRDAIRRAGGCCHHAPELGVGRLVHGREGDMVIAVHAAAAGGRRCWRHSRKSASGCCCCRLAPFWRRC